MLNRTDHDGTVVGSGSVPDVERLEEQGSGAEMLSAGPRSRPVLALVAASAAVLALLLALLLGGGRPQAAPEGLPDAGALTGWALPLAKVAFDVAGVGTIGFLLVAAVLISTAAGSGLPHGRLSPLALRATRAASWWAAGWCATTLAVLVLSLSNIVGVPIASALSMPMLRSLPWTVPLSKSLLVTAVACLAVAGFTRRTVTRRGAGVLLLLAVAALVPALFTGHAAATTDHDLATSSLVVHVVGASLWVGGLLALLICVRADERVLVTALPRFSNLALGCFVVVGFSGALSALLRLGPSASTWFSSYGALLVAKAGSLVLLGWLGLVHRRRGVPALLAGRPRSFLRLAAGEVVIMAAVIGLAVALGRTPAPASAAAARSESVPTHGLGHDTLSWEVLPWSPASILTTWRPDAVVLTAVGLAAAAYFLGVRRLARRGQPWPRRRTASAMAGLAITTLALCGGLASYSTALFSIQVAQVLVLSTVVPILLTLGMPLTLVSQARPGHRSLLTGKAARALANPVNGLSLLVAAFIGLYATPLFEISLRYFTLHLLANVLALACGLAFFWSVMGVDEVPERHGLADRVLSVSAFLLFLTAFGVVLVASDDLYGARWFTELDWRWVNPEADQRRGGALVWAFTLGLAACTLPVLWAQSRRTESIGADADQGRA